MQRALRLWYRVVYCVYDTRAQARDAIRPLVDRAFGEYGKVPPIVALLRYAFIAACAWCIYHYARRIKL